MARWISVTQADGENVLINLDNVTAVIGRTIFFVGGDPDDYLVAREAHTEIAARIAQAERSKA